MARFLDRLIASPLADGRQWCIENPQGFRVQTGAGLIVAPYLFITDWASIPQALWNILPPWGLYGPASIPHDRLYYEGNGSRLDADNALRECSLSLGVDEGLVNIIYNTVRAFGQAAWDRNKALRDSGYKRQALATSLPPYAAVA